MRCTVLPPHLPLSYHPIYFLQSILLYILYITLFYYPIYLWPTPMYYKLQKDTSFVLFFLCLMLSHDSLRPHGAPWPAKPFGPWDFPGKNTGVCCCFLLQGIFPTQGSNPDLLHCRQILYHWATWEAQKIFKTQFLFIKCFLAHYRGNILTCKKLKKLTTMKLLWDMSQGTRPYSNKF